MLGLVQSIVEGLTPGELSFIETLKEVSALVQCAANSFAARRQQNPRTIF